MRLKGYDYSQQGAYFITICTNNQVVYFETDASKLIVEIIWSSLPGRYSRLALDEFTIMPNHLHFIVWLDPEDVGAQIHCAPKAEGIDPQKSIGMGIPVNHSRPILGQVIRSFKSQVTRKMRIAGLAKFSWQRGFYDHVIRSEEALNKIRHYIRNNPSRWHLDRYNPDAEGDDEETKKLWEYLQREVTSTDKLN